MNKINQLLNVPSSFTYGLSLYRIILSLIIIKNCIFYLPIANELFGANGIVSFEQYGTISSAYHVPLLPFDNPYFPYLILLSTIVCAIAFMSGFYGRTSGIILFIHILILQFRNGFILDGSDNVIAVTLPFLIIANSFQYFSYNKSFRFKVNKKLKDALLFFGRSLAFFGLIGFMLQISYVYFFTALHKLQGDAWLNGTAVYYTMRVEEFRATRFNVPLTENHYFVVLSTYFTVFWELSFAFLVWFRQTRYVILILGVLLHIGILVFMRIDNFSTIMMASYLVFVDNKTYRRVIGSLNTLWSNTIPKTFKNLTSKAQTIYNGKYKI